MFQNDQNHSTKSNENTLYPTEGTRPKSLKASSEGEVSVLQSQSLQLVRAAIDTEERGIEKGKTKKEKKSDASQPQNYFSPRQLNFFPQRRRRRPLWRPASNS